jgi:hypothetical protein
MELTTEQLNNLIDTLDQCKEQIKGKSEYHDEIEDDCLKRGCIEESLLHHDLKFDCDTILVNIEACFKFLK